MAEWELQQKATFLRWLQAKLKKVPGGREVTSLEDLSDGVALCQLLEVLYPDVKMPRYNAAPKLAAHKMDNLAVAFRFLENADIKVSRDYPPAVKGGASCPTFSFFLSFFFFFSFFFFLFFFLLLIVCLLRRS